MKTLALLFLFTAVFLFMKIFPQFGGAISKKQKESYTKSIQYNKGEFQNTLNSEMNYSFFKTLREFLRKDSTRAPKTPIIPLTIDSLAFISKPKDSLYISWFGHSTFLLNIYGKIVLLDPMLGNSPAPFSWLGSKRYSKKLPIDIAKLPQIDIVVISHDHYDHLDYKTIKQIKDKVKQFVCPLGVSSHLRRWGVDESKIIELDWWQDITSEGIKLTCTPARHFSGRGLFDRNKTLWSSWVITTAKENLFFSGDGGYGPHFKEIGNKLGPFDLALMECGQYNQGWKYIHMFPEQTVQAAKDVKSQLFFPIHWGAFSLALHAWKDPVTRVIKESNRLRQVIYVPEIGQNINLSTALPKQLSWWEKY